MSPLEGAWLWLFPFPYLVHILEESFAGERFDVWIRRVIRRSLSPRMFLTLYALFIIAMTAAIAALRAGHAPWLLPALGTITTLNGLGHAAGAIATRRYSPGLLSGMLLRLPLGIAGPHGLGPHAGARPMAPGCCRRVLASVVVGLVALILSRRS